MSAPEGYMQERGYVLVQVDRNVGGFYRAECDAELSEDCGWWDSAVNLVKADQYGKAHVAETGHTVVVFRMQHVIREVKA